MTLKLWPSLMKMEAVGAVGALQVRFTFKFGQKKSNDFQFIHCFYWQANGISAGAQRIINTKTLEFKVSETSTTKKSLKMNIYELLPRPLNLKYLRLLQPKNHWKWSLLVFLECLHKLWKCLAFSIAHCTALSEPVTPRCQIRRRQQSSTWRSLETFPFSAPETRSNPTRRRRWSQYFGQFRRQSWVYQSKVSVEPI